MRLRHIEVFHAVYNCGSITAAAKALKVSQPSVSKVLAHAEMQLGYALFDRVKGKVVPTLEAERLIAHVSSVYQNIEELQRVAKNIAGSDEGRISLAVTPAFGIDVVPAAIARYLKDHPGTEFEVETLHYNQVVRAINQSRVSLGLVFQPSSEPGIIMEHLAKAEFVAVADSGVRFGQGHSARLSEMTEFPFIRLSDRGPLGQMLSSYLEESGLLQDSIVRAETYQMAKALAAHGAGVTIVDEITARSSGHESVRAVPLEPRLNFEIGLMHPEREPLSIVAQRFVTYLKAQIDEFLSKPLNSQP